jgi:hypothetical protein
MKILSKKINAESFRPYYLGIFGVEKRKETNSLSSAQKTQRIKFFKNRIKNEEYMDHAIDVIASGLRNILTKKDKPDFNKL